MAAGQASSQGKLLSAHTVFVNQKYYIWESGQTRGLQSDLTREQREERRFLCSSFHEHGYPTAEPKIPVMAVPL